MASSEAKPRRRRLRAFRVAAYTVYFTVVLAFCLAVTVSVIRSVWAMTPRRPPSQPPYATVEQCVGWAEGLWGDLERQRIGLATHVPVKGADVSWETFRVSWLQRHRAAEAQCGVESDDRRVVRDLFRQLDKAMDLYTTQSVQFAGEVGPTLDKLKSSMAQARDLGSRK